MCVTLFRALPWSVTYYLNDPSLGTILGGAREGRGWCSDFFCVWCDDGDEEVSFDGDVDVSLKYDKEKWSVQRNQNI